MLKGLDWVNADAVFSSVGIGLLYVLLIVSVFLSCYYLLLVLFPNTPLFRVYRYGRAAGGKSRMGKLFQKAGADPTGEWERLLRSAGVLRHHGAYLVIRKMVRWLLTAFVLLLCVGHFFRIVHMEFVITAGIMVMGGYILTIMDKPVLLALGKRRGRRIAADLNDVMRQLLYFEHSRLNLHSKLLRCVPFSGLVSKEMTVMTQEWYGSPQEAIQHFARKIGTDEARLFGETIQMMRQHDQHDCYALLQDRIQEFKERMRFLKDSQSEGKSYVFFVLAGLPILNTFRIFLYPWVEEGQRLFELLN